MTLNADLNRIFCGFVFLAGGFVQKQNKIFLLFLFAIIFTLVGCGADITRSVTFYQDEEWEADMEIAMPGELLALLGTAEELEKSTAEEVTDWETKGAQVSWKSSREETTLIYTFHIEGTGWDLLNEIIFEDRAQISVEEVGGQRQIHFAYLVSGDLSGANSDVLTLHGGKIISSNGEHLSSGQVQWINTGQRAEAVFTEKARFSFSAFLIIALALGAVGGGVWYFWQKNSQSPVSSQPVFCANCGMQLMSQAKFCPHCGSKNH